MTAPLSSAQRADLAQALQAQGLAVPAIALVLGVDVDGVLADPAGGDFSPVEALAGVADATPAAQPALQEPPELLAYLARLRLAGMRPTTGRTRRVVLLAFLATLDGRGLLEGTRGDVEVFVGRADLKAQSRRAYLSTLKSFYAWAVDEEHLTADPTRRVPAVRVPRAVPRPIGGDNLDKALSRGNPRMRAWLLLMSLAGLRCVEVSRLRPQDLAPAGTGSLLFLRECKGGGSATVPAHPMILEALAALPIRDGLWWDVSADSVSRQVNAHLRGCGVLDTAHSLRHFAGTSWYRASGHDLLTTATLLRHASVTTSQIYAQLDPERPAEVVNAVPLRLIAGVDRASQRSRPGGPAAAFDCATRLPASTVPACCAFSYAADPCSSSSRSWSSTCSTSVVRSARIGNARASRSLPPSR